ncbi:unnamed protein product [Rotaria sp. Silwood1]|nr:unnamed protein product [Rotaria sp. Silwood1]
MDNIISNKTYKHVGNQIYGQQGFNPIFGPDAFDDVILNVDYGAMDSYNIGIQSHGFTSGQIQGGFGAGGPVLGGIGAPVVGDFGGSGLGGFDVGGSVLGGFGLGGINVGGSVMGGFGAGGPQFDAAKAVFNLADTNKDGVLSRNEFQQWAQGGIQNVGGQLHSIHPTKAGVTTTAINNPNNLNLPKVPQGFNPQIANILEQSGLSKFV